MARSAFAVAGWGSEPAFSKSANTSSADRAAACASTSSSPDSVTALDSRRVIVAWTGIRSWA